MIELSRAELLAFLSGQVIHPTSHLEPGYVVVKTEGKILGCGLYGKACLKSQLPRPWGRAVIRGEEEG